MPKREYEIAREIFLRILRLRLRWSVHAWRPSRMMSAGRGSAAISGPAIFLVRLA